MFEVKKATEKDFSILCQLRDQLIEETGNDTHHQDPHNNIKIYLKRDYSIFFIAYKEGQPIGFIHGTIDPKPQEHIQAYIQDLFVSKQHRRNGVGTLLLKKLQEHFDAHNVNPGVTVDADNTYLDFYKKHGFKIYRTENNIAYLMKD